MSLGEQLFLGMVVAVFVGYGILLATLCWLDGRYDKQPRAADRVGNEHGADIGHSAALAGRHA